MKDHQEHSQPADDAHGQHSMYGRLALMLAASYIAMYLLMYSMVDTLRDVMPNINQAYMAAIMTGPMGLLELGLMSRMYPDRSKNLLFGLACLGLLAIGWWGMRTQAAVGDQQFLKSMIPHHSGALLMCRKAKLESPATRELCQQIVDAQIREIAQMRAMLEN